MTDQSINVCSDSHEVVALLRNIAEIVVGEGAVINRAAMIVEEGGSLRVESPRSASTTVLFGMPQSVLAGVNLGAWDWQGDDLVFSASEDAGGVKADLLSAHCELYNATGKGRWFRTHHPRAVLVDAPEITSLVKRLKPGFTPDASADGFLRTRVLGNRKSASGDQPDPVLMPLIDNLNNHPNGAPFSRHQGISVNVSHPTETSECFASYGQQRSDPLGLALAYGYVDSAKGEAISAPVTVTVDGLGDVSVGYLTGDRKSPLDPPRVFRDDDGLHLSHITFQRDQPRRILVPLRMMFTALGAAGDPDLAARELTAAVVEANMTLLESLESAVRSYSLDGLNVIPAAIEAQKSVIRSGSGVG